MDGWWKLKAEYADGSEPNEVDLEHIGEMIRQGYVEGHLYKEESYDLSEQKLSEQENKTESSE